MQLTIESSIRNAVRSPAVHASACLVCMASALGCSDEPSNTTSAGSGDSAATTASSSSTSSASSGTGGTGGTGTTGTGGSGGAGGAGGSGGGNAVPVLVPLSPTGHDRFFGVTFDPQGNIYATGVIADSTDAAADFAMVVAKFLPAGVLDTTFGTGGVARHNAAVGTDGELARGIVVQSTGKVVIAGTVEHAGATDLRDRDIAVVRFNTDGTLDTNFGSSGVAILDLSDGEVAGTSYVADGHWGLSVFSDDDLLVTGSQKRVGGTDTDFAVVRLDPDGARDNTFGTNGVTTLDINQQGANPRNGTILADGSIVVCGYTRDSNNVVSPVLFKLTGTGQFDNTFGANGVFNQIVLASATEAYGAALQGTQFVTVGYGRNDAMESLDWLSIRVSSAGLLDSTYGASGLARIDVAGFNDNGRALVTLADNRVMMVGGGRPTMDNIDPMVAVLTPDGQPDTTFGPSGFNLYDVGGPADFFWAIALSPSQAVAAIVGLKGVGMTAGNDDAALFLLPIH